MDDGDTHFRRDDDDDARDDLDFDIDLDDEEEDEDDNFPVFTDELPLSDLACPLPVVVVVLPDILPPPAVPSDRLLL